MSSTCVSFVTQIYRKFSTHFPRGFLTKSMNAPIVFSKVTTCLYYHGLLQFASMPKHHIEENVLQNVARWPNSYLPSEVFVLLF
jgi:hypothetical protein